MTIGIFASGGAIAQTTEYEVTITVTGENGNPISGATVRSDSDSATTNPNGEATLQVEEGTHTIEASAMGYISTTRSETITADESLDFTLEESEELAALREQLDQLSEAIDSLEEDRDRLEEERQRLETERDELADRVDESERQIEELEAELENESMPGFGPVAALIAILIGVLVRRG